MVAIPQQMSFEQMFCSVVGIFSTPAYATYVAIQNYAMYIVQHTAMTHARVLTRKSTGTEMKYDKSGIYAIFVLIVLCE